MDIGSAVSILVALIIGGASSLTSRWRGRSSLSVVAVAKTGLGISIGIVAITTFYLTREQFLTWRASELSKYFIPPYHTIGYFLLYALGRFWAPYIISLAAALLIGIIAWQGNKRRGGLLFEKEELYFLATGIFVVGHPAWILYIVVVLVFYFLLSTFYFLVSRRIERVSLYYYWLPLAAATIVLSIFLRHYDWYANFLI